MPDLPPGKPRTPDQGSLESEIGPTMYAELERAGQLDEAVYTAQELTSGAIYTAITEHGLAPEQARELFREE
jgi:hypothetical protein